METRGKHLLAEYHGCETAMLDDLERLEPAMRRAVEAAGATVVAAVFHRFAPQGVSGVLVLEESHLSIHTWPEAGYAAVDFYTCGQCQPVLGHDVLRDALGASQAEVLAVDRGLPDGHRRSMAVDGHRRELADAAE